MDNISFKKWAFHFIIWFFLIKIILFCLRKAHIILVDESRLGFQILELSLIVLCFLFIILSSVKKEKKNYQYWISILGLFIFILPIILFILVMLFL